MTIYNLIILDASGSMQSIREATISGFNELIQGIRAEGEKDPELTQYIQFFSFNSMGIKELIPLRPATDLPQLNEENYRPDAMTPLFDAIGHAVSKLRIALEGKRDYSVLVTILTDGAENDSREYTRQTIANIIRKLEQENWVFTFMGTNQDAHSEAAKISITNVVQFGYSQAGTKKVLKDEMKFRSRFYADMKAGRMEEAKKAFYRKDEEKTDANDEDQLP